MENSQWQIFQNVANNDNDAKTYSKNDIKKALSMSESVFSKDIADETQNYPAVRRSFDKRQHKRFCKRHILQGRKQKSLRARAELLFLPRRNRRLSAGFTPKRARGVGYSLACVHIRYYHFVWADFRQNNLWLFMSVWVDSRTFV